MKNTILESGTKTHTFLEEVFYNPKVCTHTQSGTQTFDLTALSERSLKRLREAGFDTKESILDFAHELYSQTIKNSSPRKATPHFY